MTSRSVESEIRELKEQQDALVKEINRLKEKVENIEKGTKIELKPMILDHSEHQDFYARQAWLEEQRKKHPDELLAYINQDDEYKLIAHSKRESDLLAQIDALLEQNIISQEDIILFDS
ncbi:MAG: hypothetical protein ACOC35_00770 [Promethearchaeia archaeon]